MKKILTFLSVILCMGIFASCSNSSSTKVDSTSATERLGVEWLSQNNTVEYRTPMNESGEGAHFTLALPQDINGMIRAHFVPLTKAQTKNGSVKVNYASQRLSSLSSLKNSITEIVEENKTFINQRVFSYDADIQTTWSRSIEVENKDNLGVFIYYLPMRLNYYSGTDESTTGILYTYVLVPVYSIVTEYTLTDGVYTFSDQKAEFNKGILIDWTANKSGSIA